jgi:hypothetical protein
MFKTAPLTLLIVFAIVGFKLHAQSGYHTPSSIVTFASFNEDQSKLLTISADEIILFDFINKKEIWKLLPAQLNLAVSYYPKLSASIDEKLHKLRICGDKAGCSILDIETWLQGTLDGTLDCTASGSSLVVQNSGKTKFGNNYDYYLFDPTTQTKTLIVSNCNKGQIFPGTNLIVFFFNDKGFQTDNSKTLFYDASLSKFVKDPVPNFKRYTTGFYRNNKRYNTSSKEKKIFVTDLVQNTTQEINSTHIPVDFFLERIYGGILPYGSTKNTIDVLEYEVRDDLTYSFLCTYDIVNKTLLNKTELSNDTEITRALAHAIINGRKGEINKQNDTYANYDYNLLAKFKPLAGKTVFHNATKHIFTVVENQTPDTSGKIKMKAICDDKKMEIYESVLVTDLLNTGLYNPIRSHTTCTNCSGTGKFSNTAERTVWDATISSGAKVIETNTVRGSCEACGGYGRIPIF